jgi:type IV secretion system protein VirB3
MADIPTTQRLTVIHPSINRPTQWLGADRELVVVAAGLSFLLGMALATWWGVGLSILLWLSSVAVLQRMGKVDPMLRQVYRRHIQYGNYYPARSGLHSSGLTCRKDWM